jgi:hypothetical protein
MYQTRILITEILIAGLSVKYRWLLREGNLMQQSAKRKDPPAEPFSLGVEALLIADRDHSSPSLLRFMSRFNKLRQPRNIRRYPARLVRGLASPRPGRATVDPSHSLTGRIPDGVAAGCLVSVPRGREAAGGFFGYRMRISAHSCGHFWFNTSIKSTPFGSQTFWLMPAPGGKVIHPAASLRPA